MKRAIIVVLAIIVAAVGTLILSKNVIARVVLIRGVKAVTGLDLTIRRMDAGFLNTNIDIQGLQVRNPAGFPDPLMVDLPELYVDYDLGAFLKGAVHLQTIRLNLNELTVVKNHRGEVNLDALRTVEESKEREKAQQRKPRAASKPPQIMVDVLELRIGKVVYKDYTAGTPQVRTFNVNVHERFRNISNPDTLAAIIVTRALAKTTIASLAHLDLRALESEVASLLHVSLDQAGEVGKGVLDTTEGVVKGTAGTLKKLLGQ